MAGYLFFFFQPKKTFDNNPAAAATNDDLSHAVFKGKKKKLGLDGWMDGWMHVK